MLNGELVKRIMTRGEGVLNTSRVRAAIDPLGGRTSYVHDAAGRQVRTQNALGRIYDLAGRSKVHVDPHGNRVTSVLDSAGRSVATINALGKRSSTVYDDANRPIAAINPLGHRMSYLRPSRSVARGVHP